MRKTVLTLFLNSLSRRENCHTVCQIVSKANCTKGKQIIAEIIRGTYLENNPHLLNLRISGDDVLELQIQHEQEGENRWSLRDLTNLREIAAVQRTVVNALDLHVNGCNKCNI